MPATEYLATQPWSMSTPVMRWNGKSGAPALYQTSVAREPISQISSLATISATSRSE